MDFYGDAFEDVEGDGSTTPTPSVPASATELRHYDQAGGATTETQSELYNISSLNNCCAPCSTTMMKDDDDDDDDAIRTLPCMTNSKEPRSPRLFYAGFREGAVEVVESALQEGFDGGFEQGIKDGVSVGRMLGALSALSAFVKSEGGEEGAGAGAQTGGGGGQGQSVLITSLQDRIRSDVAATRLPDPQVAEQVHSHVWRVLGESAAQRMFPPGGQGADTVGAVPGTT